VFFFPIGSVIRPVARVYYTYQVLMPLDLIDFIYSLCRILKFFSVYPIHVLKPLKHNN
jgi:hypothetical protein